MRFTKEIVLNKPIEDVRVLTSAPAHLHEWQPDLVSITQHTETPGAPGATATLKYQRGKLHETVLAATADERKFRYESTAQVHTITYRYEAIDDQHTRLSYENEMRLSGLLRLFTGRITKTATARAENLLGNLKTYIDNA